VYGATLEQICVILSTQCDPSLTRAMPEIVKVIIGQSSWLVTGRKVQLIGLIKR